MPFIAGATLVSAGIGASSSSKAASAQEEAMAQERASREKDLAFRQQMYNEEKAFTQPMRDQLKAMATGNQSIGYAQNSGQIKKQYADALRNLTGQGSVNSGLAGGAARQAEFGEAQDLSKVYDEGVMKRLSLLQQMGLGGKITELGMNVSGGMDNLASMYGNRGNMFGDLAGMGGKAIGDAISSGMSAYGNSQGKTSNKTTIINSGTTPPKFDFTQRPSNLNNANNMFSSASSFKPFK